MCGHPLEVTLQLNVGVVKKNIKPLSNSILTPVSLPPL